VVVAGVVAALVTGYLVGSRGDESTPAAADLDLPGPGLVAGSVREGADAWERVTFEVVLHNSGAEPAVVYLSRIGPVDVHRDVTRGPVRVAAGATALVDVAAPSACEHDLDAAFTTVTADVDRGEGRQPEEIPLLDATALLDYLDGVCRAPTTDLPASALEGVWALEEVYGRQAADEDQVLMWFRPDGTFVADRAGQLFTVRAGLRGRYVLGLGVLRMRVDGGSWCEPGQGAVWQVHRRTSRLLDLRYLRGSCPFEPEGLWKLRQVLTSVPPGVAW
jgi:hypothetical protein